MLEGIRLQMRKPVIGIGSDVLTETGIRDRATTYLTYVEALRRYGAVPVILPPQGENIGELLGAIDGLLLAGGEDCDPAVYGEERHETVEPMDPRRQNNDLALARAAREQRVPTLGICLGMQILNIAAGGTLIQDIDSQVATDIQHASMPSDRVRHPVTIEPASKLGKMVGETAIEVNSSHHQAVKAVGEGLVITARAADGVVEGLEDPALPFYVGVQWHPEDMKGEASAEAIFGAFLEAARWRRSSQDASQSSPRVSTVSE
jgi:putative glutamine amidotransferase